MTKRHFHWTEDQMVRILGIPILTRAPLAHIFLECLHTHLMVTANPEILVRTTKDERYRSIIANADAIVADGFGIVIAGLLQGKKIQRFTGVQLAQKLFQIAQE